MTTTSRKRKTTPRQLVANRRNARKSTGPRTDEGKAIAATNAMKHGLLSGLQVLPRLESQEDWDAHFSQVITDLRPAGVLEGALAERVALLLWRLGRVARYERTITATALENSENDMGREGYQKVGPLPEAEQEAQEAREWLDVIECLDDLPEARPLDPDIVVKLLERTAHAAQVDLYAGKLSFHGYPDGAAPEDVDWTAGLLRNCLSGIAEAGDMRPQELRDALLLGQRQMVETKTAEVAALRARLEQYRQHLILPQGPDLEKVSRYETSIERSLYKALHELQRLQAARQGASVTAPVAVDVTLDGSHGGA